MNPFRLCLLTAEIFSFGLIPSKSVSTFGMEKWNGTSWTELAVVHEMLVSTNAAQTPKRSALLPPLCFAAANTHLLDGLLAGVDPLE